MLELDTLEALGALKAALKFLEDLDCFEGKIIREDGIPNTIVYMKPDIVEAIITGADFPMRKEGDKILLPQGKLEQGDQLDDENGNDQLYLFTWRVNDPRWVLKYLWDVWIDVGEDQKVVRAVFNVLGLHPPRNLVKYIRGASIGWFSDEQSRYLTDVATWTKMQNPGNVEPMVEFVLDRDNRPLRMTIGRILPGDANSFTIEFVYNSHEEVEHGIA